MSSFWEYYCQIGWRWNVALSLVAAAIFIDRNLTSDAAMLRIPMIVGCGSGLVLLKEFPTEWPKEETEWFKVVIAVAAAAILLWGAGLVAHNAIGTWVAGKSIESVGVWLIVLVLLMLLFGAAYIVVWLRWLAQKIWKSCRRGANLRLDGGSDGHDDGAAAKWAEARQLADGALKAAREAGRFERNSPS